MIAGLLAAIIRFLFTEEGSVSEQKPDRVYIKLFA
jgi:hypothetical protein